ncbi:MAG: hypothetical protein RLZZ210_1113 [Pseudomonadota bacterium]|jgi:hypothetical protein
MKNSIRKITRIISICLHLCLILSISLHTAPTQAQSGVRPLAYTAGSVLALGTVASIQQQQKRCRETGIGCRNNYSGSLNNSNQPRRSLSEIFRDVNNPNRYNQNRYNNSANRHVISGSDIVNGISNFFKHKFSGKSQAETALDNQSMMIIHQMNNATDPQARQYLQAQYEANFQARVDLARAEGAQRTQQALQQRQQPINNLNNSNNINNASWGNDVQSQDRYSIAGTSGIGTPTAMLPINANLAVNRNDYIMINPDINHQGHNMGNGVISTPNQGVNAQNGQNSIVPAPVYVNPSANSNQGLVNSQTQPITTPITSDANLQGGVIVTPEYIASPSDNITTMAGYTPNAGGVANMGKFFELNNFGGMLGSNSTKTSLSIKGSSVYKSNINIGVIKKGDLFYLDSQHKDHIEVFSASNRTSKAVLNLDGSINEPKTIGARGRVIPK